MWWLQNQRGPDAKAQPWRCCRAISTWSAKKTRARRTTSTPIPSKYFAMGNGSRGRGGAWAPANGVGVAAALAVMESTDIAHGPLEFVFTIDEETALTGAAEFPGGVLKSKYFFNLDNEEIGTLCIGCSGGVKTTGRRKVAFAPATGNSAWRIKVFRLKGGHWGADIHQGR